MAVNNKATESFGTWLQGAASGTMAKMVAGAGALLLLQQLDKARQDRLAMKLVAADSSRSSNCEIYKRATVTDKQDRARILEDSSAPVWKEVRTLGAELASIQESLRKVSEDMSYLTEVVMKHHEGHLHRSSSRHNLKRCPTIDEHKALHDAAVSAFSAGLHFNSVVSTTSSTRTEHAQTANLFHVQPWERSDRIWMASLRPPSSKTSSVTSNGSSETYASSVSDPQPDPDCVAINHGNDRFSPFLGEAADRNESRPCRRLPMNPFSGQVTHVCQNPVFYNLRQDMLNHMWNPQELERIFKGSTNIVANARSAERGLFDVMYTAWSGAAQYACHHDPHLGCEAALNQLAMNHADAAVRMYADIHSAWSSQTALRHANSSENFDSLANRINRALTSFSFSSNVDPLVKAELLQIAVDFMAHEAATSPHGRDEDTRLVLRYFQHSEHQNKKILGREGTILVAHKLWQEAFRNFYESGCYYDAAALCVAMVLLVGSTEGLAIDTSSYLDSYDCAVSRMTSAARNAFEEYGLNMKKMLGQHGRINREFFDFQYAGVPFLRDNPIPRNQLRFQSGSGGSSSSRLAMPRSSV